MDVISSGRTRHRLTVLLGRMRDRLAEESPPVWWSAGDDDVVEVLQELEALRRRWRRCRWRRSPRSTGGAPAQRLERPRRGTGCPGALRMRPEHAARAVKLARELDGDLAATGIALRAGQLSADHAQVIARAVTGPAQGGRPADPCRRRAVPPGPGQGVPSQGPGPVGAQGVGGGRSGVGGSGVGQAARRRGSQGRTGTGAVAV